MRGLRDAMNRIADDGSYFVRARDVRLWVIDAQGFPWGAWPKVAMALDLHPENFAPFVLLPDAFTVADDGFATRAARLVERWTRQCEGMAKEGVFLPKVDVVPDPRADASFARTLMQIARAIRTPLTGLVVVLAPSRVETPDAVERALELLLAAPELANVRWVFAHTGDAPLERLRGPIGDAALVTDARVPEDDFANDVEALLASADGNDRRFGQVWPKGIVAPRRVDEPPEVPRPVLEAELRALGVSPELALGEEGPRFRRCVLEAALASRAARFVDAVNWQKEACVLAQRLGLRKELLVCRMALAGYVHAGGRPDLALREYTDTAKLALELGDELTASQVYLAIGMLEAVRTRLAEAGSAYVRAAELAEKSAVHALAIEAYRLAGQLALDVRAETQAVECFARAIRLADDASAEQVALSSAPLAARTLAEILARHGRRDHAAVLHEKADAFERVRVAALRGATA